MQNLCLKCKNKMLPISFDNYFTNFNETHKYSTRQKVKSGYYDLHLIAIFGENDSIMSALKLWESISLANKRVLL